MRLGFRWLATRVPRTLSQLLLTLGGFSVFSSVKAQVPILLNSLLLY